MDEAGYSVNEGFARGICKTARVMEQRQNELAKGSPESTEARNQEELLRGTKRKEE